MEERAEERERTDIDRTWHNNNTKARKQVRSNTISSSSSSPHHRHRHHHFLHCCCRRRKSRHHHHRHRRRCCCCCCCCCRCCRHTHTQAHRHTLKTNHHQNQPATQGTTVRHRHKPETQTLGREKKSSKNTTNKFSQISQQESKFLPGTFFSRRYPPGKIVFIFQFVTSKNQQFSLEKRKKKFRISKLFLFMIFLVLKSVFFSLF